MINKSKKHLKEVSETYTQHSRFALGVATKMLIAGVQCFLHALIPGIFQNSGSKTIKELYERINNRN